MQKHLNTFAVATSVAALALLATPIVDHYAGLGLVAVARAADSHDHASGSTSSSAGRGRGSSQKGESHSKEGHKGGGSSKGGTTSHGTSHDTSAEGASKSLEGKVFSADTGHGSDKDHKGKGPKYMGGGKGGEDHASGTDTAHEHTK